MTFTDTTSLYMFAIMPPPELAARIDNERQNFAKKFNFVKALKPPVHITLFPPFKLPSPIAPAFEKEIRHLQRWANWQLAFDIQLNNYGFFENKHNPVVYISLLKNKSLSVMHKSFINELNKYLPFEKKNNFYNPHITIGYRDIDPKVFPEIKHAYSKRHFSGQFTCNSIYLWKHDGMNWQILHEFPCGNMLLQLSLF